SRVRARARRRPSAGSADRDLESWTQILINHGRRGHAAPALERLVRLERPDLEREADRERAQAPARQPAQRALRPALPAALRLDHHLSRRVAHADVLADALDARVLLAFQ